MKKKKKLYIYLSSEGYEKSHRIYQQSCGTGNTKKSDVKATQQWHAEVFLKCLMFAK